MTQPFGIQPAATGLVLWNPTEEEFHMEYAGVPLTMKPGDKEQFEINCAKHLLNGFGPRGLTALSYGCDEARIKKEALERNHDFKQKQVIEYNQRNANRKQMGLRFLPPTATTKQYAVELGLKLDEPYALTMPDSSAAPVVVIACRVFEALLERRMLGDRAWQVTYLDYGLHALPRKLTQTVQEAIDAIETPSLIVLGYALCGNGLSGVKAGPHTLLIARADDCIAMLLGSYQTYRREFDQEPGTYYLTKGWLESGCDPLGLYESYLRKYDRDTADYLIESQFKHYRRLALVAHSAEDMKRCRPRALQVAEFCQRWQMAYMELTGSEAYVDRLVEAVDSLDQAGEDFLVISPGGEIQQTMFIRDTV